MKEFGDRIKSFLLTLLAIVILMGLGFFAGIVFRNHQLAATAEIVDENENENESDLQLPTEVEKRIVTKDEVTAKLEGIDELSTYMGKYTVDKTIDQSRYLLDNFAIPGTENSIHISCEGIVKISYSISDIEIEVKDDTIFIALPDGYVSDNYLIWDSMQCEEQNSILNPIDFEEYQELITEIEDEGLEKAKEHGIYEAADKNLKYIINNFLSAFDGYTIKYM